jgi:Putative Flp pilus-assembly TadE/G-like
MKTSKQRFGDDRGAVLVHTAFALLAIFALSAFVLDYGVLWAARRQAQNSADAAALAGAIALAYDDPTDFSDTGPAKETAYAVSQQNVVWGAPPSVTISTDIQILCPTGCALPCPDGSSNTCVRVDVYRDAPHGNALPTFFGQMIGITSQNVKATATAEVATANGTDCLKPWGVIDKWEERYPTPVVPFTVDQSVFNKYNKQGDIDPSIPVPDLYVPPTEADPYSGTGFRPYNADGSYTSDYGLQLRLKVGGKADFEFATGWFSSLALFDSTGGKDLRNNIKHCVGATYKIGDELPIDTEPGEKVGPTKMGVEDDADSLVNQDPTAVWNQSLNGGRGGVDKSAFPTSPRIVAIPVVNPDVMADAQKGGRTSVPIANILGFFVERYDNKEKAVVGRLMTMPGVLVEGGPSVGGASFLKVILLIR